jgi:hypothetical protein
MALITFFGVILLLSLAPQPSLGLGLLLKIWLNFLEASQQFSFLQGRVRGISLSNIWSLWAFSLISPAQNIQLLSF